MDGSINFKQADVGCVSICEPKAHGFWRRMCKKPHPREPSGITPYVDEVIQRGAPNFSGFDESDICDLINVDPPENDMCRKASRELAVLLLNIASHRLTSCQGLLAGGSVQDGIDEIKSLIASGDCRAARKLGGSINAGAALSPCDEAESLTRFWIAQKRNTGQNEALTAAFFDGDGDGFPDDPLWNGTYYWGLFHSDHEINLDEPCRSWWFDEGPIIGGPFGFQTDLASGDTISQCWVAADFDPPGHVAGELVLRAVVLVPSAASADDDDVDVISSLKPSTNSLFTLLASSPNPVRGETEIRFTLPTDAPVTLKVYDLTGSLVRTLVDRNFEAGEHAIRWDAKEVANGVYFYRFTSGGISKTQKFVTLR